jgi:hypothetical protein
MRTDCIGPQSYFPAASSIRPTRARRRREVLDLLLHRIARRPYPFGHAWIERIRHAHLKHELRGTYLACLCRLDQQCYADNLLELANK